MAQLKLTGEILAAALIGLEEQKKQLDIKISEIRQMLDGGRTESAATPSETGRPKRKFNAATRRKMAASQRARYAKLKQGSEPMQPVNAKPKRKVSRQARKKMAAAQKARWQKIKAAA